MAEVGNDTPLQQNLTMGNAALQARQIVKATVDPAAKFSMDAFKTSIMNPGATGKQIAERTMANTALQDALQQQSVFTRFAARIPFVRNFLGPGFPLNEAIGATSKEALNGVTKATVTKIALEGGDVAGKLIAAGVSPDAAKQIAAKSAERLVAMGGAAATEVAQTAAKTVATNVADDLAKQAIGYTMKKGFTAASEEAVKKALASPNSYEALKNLGFYAKDAKALVAKAATGAAESVAKTAATETAQAATKTAATETAKKGAGGFFKSLFGGIKGNFVIAGIFSLVGNTIQLAQGKMDIKQFLGLTVMDTVAYGAIGWGSAAAGGAIAQALIPIPGVGFLIGLGIGFLAGHLYDKFVRTPVKDALGGAPSGGATPQSYDPNAYGRQDPYGGAYTPAPLSTAEQISYDEAQRAINQLAQGQR